MSVMASLPVFSRVGSFLSGGAALIASPDSSLRAQVLDRLNGRCRPVTQALGGAEALAQLEKGGCQILFLDRRLPDLDAEELMATIRRRFPGTEVVLLDPEMDGEPSRELDPQKEKQTQAVEAPALSGPSTYAADFPERKLVAPLAGMVGTSPAMQRVYRLVELVADRNTTVLIAGPTGTGKELVARALHGLSRRASRPLVVVNCAAIPETLLESELFGYSRGAFTGAVQAQLGRIPAAHGGTLFLDEVSELPLGMQAKLLRFLEQKEVQRLGAAEATRVDVRVLAASNVDLGRRAARGEFRSDLFYRLSAFPIALPPLAERAADIVPLAEHFLAVMAAAMERPRIRLSEAAKSALKIHDWRGNVRELQHVIERASILIEKGDVVEVEHLCLSSLDALTAPDLDLGVESGRSPQLF
ncbi:MAG TPA: sigma-54 dependent transcriptional regulator [Candidatus Solibacter sp.]|nr:sigma-54 dependent transcriptional regulator [Candidatus Solibacter sp.]